MDILGEPDATETERVVPLITSERGGTGNMSFPHRKRGIVLVICVFLLAPAAAALADCNVSPGTTITKQNWMQYKDCFSEGVQHFWQGDLFWKMPDDVSIKVGPQHTYVLPKPFVEATEKY